jgi:hypothetical protein
MRLLRAISASTGASVDRSTSTFSPKPSTVSRSITSRP